MSDAISPPHIAPHDAPQAAPPQAAGGHLKNHNLTVRGVRYALGLFWQITHEANPRRIRAEAVRFAKKLPDRHSFFCIKQDGISQYAVGDDRNGYSAKTLSAAETVFQNVKPNASFIGAWSIGKKFWVCIIKAGAIYPNGDQIYDHEEEARSVVEQNALVETWDTVIAPAHWDISGAEDAPLEDYFKRPGHARLNITQQQRQKILAAICSLLLLGGGFYFYREYTAATAAITDIPQITIRPAKKLIEPAWKYLPQNTAIHNGCMRNVRHIRRAFIRIPGWVGTDIVCDLRERKITARWNRNTGTANLFRQYARRYFPGENVIFGAGGANASLSRQWEIEEEAIVERAPKLSSEDIEIQLWSLRQKTRLDLNISRAEVDNRVIFTPKGVIVRKGKGISFRVSTQLKPENVFAILYKMAGSVIYEIRFNNSNSSWEMEGFIYATDKA